MDIRKNTIENSEYLEIVSNSLAEKADKEEIKKNLDDLTKSVAVDKEDLGGIKQALERKADEQIVMDIRKNTIENSEYLEIVSSSVADKADKEDLAEVKQVLELKADKADVEKIATVTEKRCMEEISKVFDNKSRTDELIEMKQYLKHLVESNKADASDVSIVDKLMTTSCVENDVDCRNTRNISNEINWLVVLF